MSVESENKKRKVIALYMNLDTIKRFDNVQSKTSISRALGLNESTVRLILSKCNEYKEQGKVASTFIEYGAPGPEVLFWLKWRIF